MQEIIIINSTHSNIDIALVAADALGAMHRSYFDVQEQADEYQHVCIEV